MTTIFLFLLNILAIRLQLTFFHNIILFEVPLITSLWFFLNPQISPSQGLFFACFLGLVSDYSYGYPLGFYGFSLTLVGYITYHLYTKLYIQGKIFLFFIFLLSHFLNSLTLFFLVLAFHIQISREFLISSIISAFLGSILLSILIKKR